MASSIEKDKKIRETDKIMACRYTNRDPNKQEVGLIFCMKRLRTLTSFQIFKTEIKKSKTYSVVMTFSGPVQWYHPHADPIWPGGTFKK
jgi:hypothetical protein